MSIVTFGFSGDGHGLVVTFGFGAAAPETPTFEPLDAYPNPYASTTSATIDTFAARSRLRGS